MAIIGNAEAAPQLSIDLIKIMDQRLSAIENRNAHLERFLDQVIHLLFLHVCFHAWINVFSFMELTLLSASSTEVADFCINCTLHCNYLIYPLMTAWIDTFWIFNGQQRAQEAQRFSTSHKRVKGKTAGNSTSSF